MDDELGRPQPGPGHSAGFQARRAGGDRVDARLQHLQLDPEIQQRRGEHVPASPAEASTQASPTPVGPQTILPGTTSNPRHAAIRPAASSIGPAHRGGSTIRRVWTATA